MYLFLRKGMTLHSFKKPNKKTLTRQKGGILREKMIILADDFTGANDTGVQFSKRGLRTMVITNKDHINKSLGNCDVLVVDTESRFDDRKTAYKKTYEIGKIVQQERIKHLYKKVDSTFRGNIGAEVAGIMDSMEIRHALIVPALPEFGRITKDGNILVNGVLLAKTETADDPKTPVPESSIPRIISHQTGKGIEVIDRAHVLSGRQNLIQKVQQHMDNGIPMIVIDAETKEDLDVIASAIPAFNEEVLPVGSSGLAGHLPKYLDLKRKKKSNIVIAGSVSEVTLRQTDYAKKNLNITLIEVDIGKIFTKGRDRERNRIVDLVKKSSLKGKNILIRSASTNTRVADSYKEGQKHGLSRVQVSESISSFLGEVARQTIQEIDINGVLFTGGETAIKAAKLLHVSGTIIQDEVLPGIPCGYFVEERYKQISIVSKAGGFGEEDAIVKVLDFLEN